MAVLRYGLIGFAQGYYAVNYTETLLDNPEVETAVCCDLARGEEYVRECAGLSAEEFCGRHGIELEHNLDGFFAHELDIVMIASEVHNHVDHLQRALAEGCHVFVAKPLSFKVDDLHKAVELGNIYPEKVILGGQPLRYECGVREIKNRVDVGEVGRVTNIRLLLNHEAMVEQAWERDPEKSGGPLGTFGIYLFDLPRWFTGEEFQELSAWGDNFVFPQISTHDTVRINGVLSEGVLVGLNLVSTITWEFPFVLLDIIGTEGVLRTNYDNYTLIKQGKGGAELGGIRYSPMGKREIGHFVDCCLGRDEPDIGLDDLLAAARCIEAAEESIRREERVRMPGN